MAAHEHEGQSSTFQSPVPSYPCLPFPAAEAETSNLSNLHTQELPTQDALTQSADWIPAFGGETFSSPLMGFTPPRRPWGRLVPCAGDLPAIDLFDIDNSNHSFPQNNSNQAEKYVPGSYTIGRSSKADVHIPRRTVAESDSMGKLQQKSSKPALDWAHAIISNRHCRICCSRVGDSNVVQGAATIHLENLSNNGTLVNRSRLVEKGEKISLKSGDEICLVNPQLLSDKIRSRAIVDYILQQHAFVFLELQHKENQSAQASSNDSSRSNKVAPAVNVRALHCHSLEHRKRPRTEPSETNRATKCDDQSCVSDRTKVEEQVPRSSPREKRLRPTRSQQQKPAPTSIRKTRIEDDYELGQVLGSGTVGQVRKAINRQTGDIRAVKVIPLGAGNSNPFLPPHQQQSSLQAEATILQKLDHPYIVHLFDAYLTETHLFLVMEYMAGGELFDRIVQRERYTQTNARRLMRRLFSAVHYLHEDCNLVHRDLKPENLLLESSKDDYNVRLVDFGLAKDLQQGGGCRTFCGTPQYFAPEVWERQRTILGVGRYGKPADLWSLGVILYVLMVGQLPPQPLCFPPYRGDNDVEQATLTVDDPAASVPPSVRDLIARLLEPDPNRRWTIVQACNHSWILIDDGDTHCHPLENPVLRNRNDRTVSTKESECEVDEASGRNQLAIVSSQTKRCATDKKSFQRTATLPKDVEDSGNIDHFEKKQPPRLDAGEQGLTPTLSATVLPTPMSCEEKDFKAKSELTKAERENQSACFSNSSAKNGLGESPEMPYTSTPKNRPSGRRHRQSVQPIQFSSGAESGDSTKPRPPPRVSEESLLAPLTRRPLSPKVINTSQRPQEFRSMILEQAASEEKQKNSAVISNRSEGSLNVDGMETPDSISSFGNIVSEGSARTALSWKSGQKSQDLKQRKRRKRKNKETHTFKTTQPATKTQMKPLPPSGKKQTTLASLWAKK